MQFKRLLLLLFSILIGFPFSQLTYWNSVQWCVFICQFFQATVTEIMCFHRVRAFKALAFSQVRIYTSSVFTLFFFNFFKLFYLPFPDSFFLLFIIPLRHFYNSAHSWKKETKLSLRYRLYLEWACLFLCFYGFFFSFAFFFLFKLG